MGFELRSKGFDVQSQIALPLVYKGMRLEAGYRIDLLANNTLLVDIKAIESLADIPIAQVLLTLNCAICTWAY